MKKYSWGWTLKEVISPKKKEKLDDYQRKVRDTRYKHEQKFKDVKQEVKRRGWVK